MARCLWRPALMCLWVVDCESVSHGGGCWRDIGSDLRLSSGGEIEVVSGSGVVGRVGESVDIVAAVGEPVEWVVDGGGVWR